LVNGKKEMKDTIKDLVKTTQCGVKNRVGLHFHVCWGGFPEKLGTQEYCLPYLTYLPIHQYLVLSSISNGLSDITICKITVTLMFLKILNFVTLTIAKTKNILAALLSNDEYQHQVCYANLCFYNTYDGTLSLRNCSFPGSTVGTIIQIICRTVFFAALIMFPSSMII